MSSQYTILAQESLLHIVGPDSLTFLQGQTTCDTRSVDSGHAIPGAYCTPKGRVVCDFLLCQIGEQHFALRMRKDILETSAATFGKYIIFSRAELDSSNQDWQLYGCWGSDAKAILQTTLGIAAADNEPDQRYNCASGDGYVLVQVDECGEQFECYINIGSHPALARQLTSSMSAGDTDNWLALQIEQGVARIEAATVEEFIPQMLNYDMTGHISFNKGCYTGQEVVARLHYRGKPKRRLYLAKLAGTEPPPAGTLLYSVNDSQNTGSVANSATINGQIIALVVATVEGINSGLHLGAHDGPAFHIDSSNLNLSPGNTG